MTSGANRRPRRQVLPEYTAPQRLNGARGRLIHMPLRFHNIALNNRPPSSGNPDSKLNTANARLMKPRYRKTAVHSDAPETTATAL